MDVSLWWPLFDAADYSIAREVLQRGVAVLFFLGFLSAWNQFPALLGDRGLTPAARLIEHTTAKEVPTLFRWRFTPYSDRVLRMVCAVGMVLAFTVVLGLPQVGPAWTPIPVFIVLWWLYMSIVNIGQRFYSFGWETLLLETGFLVGFLGSHEVAPPLLVILLLRWLAFRVEFGAGMIKMRGDSSWRDLTAMDYHHQTQPMPNPLSRWAHLMPGWWHRAETLGSHVVQLVAPWLLFLPQPVASFAASAIIITQLALILTGNYAWLNWITVLIALSGISDSFLRWVVGGPWPGWAALPESPGGTALTSSETSPAWWMVLIGVVFMCMVVLNGSAVRNLFSARQLMNASFNELKLGNAYGAFGSMTQLRREIVIEGTLNPDADPDAEEDWHAYEFRGKPGDVYRRGPIIAPYHVRLGWLMWFAALGAYHEQWFARLVQRIDSGDPQIRTLLRTDPFGGEPPALVRVRIFTYRYATTQERRQARRAQQHPPWWVRENPQTLLPATTWKNH